MEVIINYDRNFDTIGPNRIPMPNHKRETGTPNAGGSSSKRSLATVCRQFTRFKPI
jgi:hypothetical protein